MKADNLRQDLFYHFTRFFVERQPKAALRHRLHIDFKPFIMGPKENSSICPQQPD